MIDTKSKNDKSSVPLDSHFERLVNTKYVYYQLLALVQEAITV